MAMNQPVTALKILQEPGEQQQQSAKKPGKIEGNQVLYWNVPMK